MALSEEEIYQACTAFKEDRGLELSDEEVREAARDIVQRIADCNPAELERDTEVLHPCNPYNMYLQEYRGDTVLVKGIPLGGSPEKPSEFEVPSDEIFLPDQEPLGMVLIEIGPDGLSGADLAALLGFDEEGDPENE